MKRKLLFGLLLLATGLVNAQFQIINDPAFEDELIRLGHDSNPTRDGGISLADAQSITFLNLSGHPVFSSDTNLIGVGITDLTGIKAFSNVNTLWVHGNNLTELDLEGMSTLVDVRAFINNLERINLNGLTNLEIIGLNVNNLKGINVSTNTSLRTFDIAQNNLSALDIRGLSALTNTNFQDNTQLNCVLVDNTVIANTYNNNTDFRRNGSTVFSDSCPNIYTQIPDRNFEQSLLNQGYDSEGGIPNGLVLTQDLEAITNLDLSGTNFSGENISSLEGLDAFTGLTDLNISYNPLSLPNNDLVLTNTELETIIARNCNLDGASFPTILNEVVTLDFSNEDPRNVTIPSVNSFTSIDGLGGVPNVVTFSIEWNNLTLLEVAGASKIEKLFLGKNFDLTEIRSLNTLVNLNQMEADDNSLGLGTPVGTINVSSNPNLEILNLDRSKITTVDLSNNSKLRLLSISDVNLSPTINLSANASLEFLDLERSQITSLSLDSNLELGRIELDGNNLTELDISQNNKLFDIKLVDNQLTSLDISDIDTNLTNLDIRGNTTLGCVQVSNVSNANTQAGWLKETSTEYQTNCNTSQTFAVSTTIGGDVVDVSGLPCCPEYEIEEGQLLEISFDAEANAPDAEEYIVQLSFANGTATEADVSVRENSPNFQYTYSVKPTSPDNILQIDIVDDMIAETNGEDLKITLTPVGSNYAFSGTTVYDITIKDKTVVNNEPFSITTSLLGAGEEPYHEATEGDTLKLEFNADQSAQAGDTYKVAITFETFLIEEKEIDDEFGFSQITIPNHRTVHEQGDVQINPMNDEYNFIVDLTEPDGFLEFLITEDNINEGVEELIISVSVLSENVTLESASTYIIKINDNDPVDIEVSLEDAGSPGNYQVIEGSTFKLVANFLGDSDLSFDIIPDFSLGSAGFATDFYGNFDGGISAQGNTPNYGRDITVYLDSVSNENEQIVLRLPKPTGNYSWNNANNEGELEFSIDIIDKSFVVEATLEGFTKDNAGFYQVEEGETVTIDFEPDFLLQNISYSSIPLNVDIDEGQTEINRDFTVNVPDELFQAITVKVIMDGIDEEDETLQIILEKPQANYRWKNEDTNGQIVIPIKILNKENITTPPNYTLEIEAADFSIDDYFGGVKILPENGIYRIKDNQQLQIFLKSDEQSNEDKGILISTIDGSALLNKDYDASGGINIATISKFESLVGSIDFSILPEGVLSKTFDLEIAPTTKNYNITLDNGDVIPYPEKAKLNFEIEPSGTSSATKLNQIIIHRVTGATINENNQDAIFEEYLVKENDTINIFLTSLKPNLNNGAIYNMNLIIEESSTLDENDYTLKVTDFSGKDLSGNLNTYTVNNDAPFDALITIVIKQDVTTEPLEFLNITLEPDVSFDGGSPDPITEDSNFWGLSNGDQKALRFVVAQEQSPNIAYTVLSNSGGVEGSTEPDIISCSLFDLERNPFTAHTSTIEIPFEVLDYEIGNLNISENEYEILGESIFKFEPGKSMAYIEVLYKNESDENDIDCDYYYIELKEPTKNGGASIINSEDKYLVKVADLSEFLVIVDLDLNNVRPKVRVLHSDNIYQAPETPSQFFDREFIQYYEVEENSQLKFYIDAAKPVASGKTYKLNITTKGSTTTSGKDFTISGGDQVINKVVPVIKEEIDETILFDIKKDNFDEADEKLLITFLEPLNNKGKYRFAKKDARAYDNFYDIRILDAVPVEIDKVPNRDIADEENPTEKYGEFEIKIEPSNTKRKHQIHFKLSGDAEYGAMKDYIIESKNSFLIDEKSNRGIIYVNENQLKVNLKIIPINDSKDERNELVKIDLIDEFGYSLGVSQGVSITIVDDDLSDVEVYFENNINTLYEDRDQSFEGELVVKLNKSNETEQPINIGFSVEIGEKNATFNEDYELFYYDESEYGVKIETLEDFTLPIYNGFNLNRLLIRVKEDTEDGEEDETIKITIEKGEGYFPVENNKTRTITIKDPTGTQNNSDVDISAAVLSSTCEGNARGKIALQNDSKYSFITKIYHEGNYLDKLTKTLDPSSNETIDALEAGNYEIFLENIDGQALPNGEYPPSFNLVVRNASDTKLITSSVDIDFRVAKITVSGSSTYHVENGAEVYYYSIGNTASSTIEVPLHNGLNNIKIKGETDCQDVLETTLSLNSAIAYPNPSSEITYVAGFSNLMKVNLRIADLTGRMVLIDENPTINNGTLAIDLTSLTTGVYIAKIIMPDDTTLDIKLIKK